MPLLLVIALAGFAAALIVRIIDPLVPEIAREFATTPQHIALLASAFAFPYALGQPILGPLGDAVGKARIIKACLLVLAIALALSAMAPNANALFAARIFAGLAAGGTIPVALALIGDRVPMEQRQVALSRQLMAMLSGQLIGAFGAGVIGDAFGWRAVSWLGCAIVVAAWVICQLYLPPRPTAQRKPFNLKTIQDGYAVVFANPRAKICFGAVFVGGLCMFGPLPHVAALLEARAAGSIREAGFVIAGMAIGGVIYTIAVAHILRALGGQLNMIRAGGMIAAAGFITNAVGLTWPQEMAAFTVIGIGFYMIHNSLQTQASELAPTARGSALSLHAFSFFLGQAMGPPLFGLGYTALGFQTTLVIAATVLAILGWTLAHLLSATNQSA
jgi:predicted MFS family arabinose efflux permease